MLSDALYEALETIVSYQRAFPGVYAPWATRIEAVTGLMRRLMLDLELVVEAPRPVPISES